MSLTLYFAPQTRAIRPLWLLEELGVEFDLKAVDLKNGEHRSAAFQAINPAGKVPALVDGECRVFESVAICVYLADRSGSLAPKADDPKRGEYLSWMFFAAGQMEPAFADHIRKLDSNVRFAWGALETVLATIAEALDGQDYLLGDEFSAADLVVGSMLLWAASAGLLEEAQTTLHAYCARLAVRPALARARSHG